MAEFHEIAGYHVVATLGKGAASSLYSVRDKDGNPFCLKRVVKNSQAEQRFIDQAVAEYEVASQLDSPLLRKVYELKRQRNFFKTTEVLVIMELVNGRTLENIKFNGMLSYCKLMYASAKALQEMHKAGYVHADIKPNNILVQDSGQVKLIDFGQSCKNGTVKERIQGTPDYIAPEQVKRQPITFKTDLFNLGATMYWLLTGEHVPTMIPKTSSGEGLQLRSSTSTGPLTPPIKVNPACPPALSSLIMECVEKDDANRPANMQAVMDRAEIAANQVKRAAEGLTQANPVADKSLAS